MGRLEVRDMAICYDNQQVVEKLSLKVADGQLVSLLGPSGGGKTSVLKAIAGLIQPAAGEILIDGQLVNSLPADRRDVVLIFQKALLFPFLNVAQNIGFGLRMAGLPPREIAPRVAEALALTGLEGMAERRPHQLSGGQQQRVALARGLVLHPSILLLDEPLSSLDAELRAQMRDLIRQLQRQTGTTMLFVTHDQAEALAISDRLCLLLDGHLRQQGSPEELFLRPLDKEVARFFGCTNFIGGTIANNQFTSGLGSCPSEEQERADVSATIRPEHIELSPTTQTGWHRGRVIERCFEGSLTRYEVGVDEQRLSVSSVHAGIATGDTVWLRLPPEYIHILPQ